MKCTKWHNKVDLLPPIVVPQSRGGWQHNYTTKLRQGGSGCANELSIYSLMSMVLSNLILDREINVGLIPVTNGQLD
jgi:hypothetical protein